MPAGLKPSQDDTVIQIPTSTGALRAMRRAGTLEFSLKGQPLKLTAFVDLSDRNLDHLFVMFSDLTSGTETYPAGRYLDLTRNATGSLRARLQPLLSARTATTTRATSARTLRPKTD